MKKLFTIAGIAALAMAFAPIETLQVGQKIAKADVQVEDISGKNLTMREAMTKNGLIVMFSCNTCPYVVKNQERTNAILSYAQANGIGVMVLNSNEANRGREDSPEAMKDYAKKQNYKWTYAIDKNNEIADAFGATRTPECFLFDGSGTLVYHGAIDDSPGDASAVQRQHLKAAMDEMLSGRQVSVATSKSVGCAIKRASKP